MFQNKQLPDWFQNIESIDQNLLIILENPWSIDLRTKVIVLHVINFMKTYCVRAA